MLIAGCKKDPEVSNQVLDPAAPPPALNSNFGQVKITFNNMVKNDEMILNSSTYTTSIGDAYTISKFKYYISNIALTNEDGTAYKQKESYYLLDNSISSSYNLILDSIAPGKYTSIQFILGVDSARNTSGAQVGALDPLNAMFWSWNQGYIFLMMEGKAAASPAPNQAISYHIGGFVKPYNCIRNITLSLVNNPVQINKQSFSKMAIKTDADYMFSGSHGIKFATTPNVLGGSVASLMADNCISMFSITSVENQ